MIAQFGFDTLAFVKRLSAAGMDTSQAEALAEALTAHAFDELSTKADLRELGKELRAEMREMELRLRTEMKEMELRLTNGLTGRMGAMIAASTALTVAILGALVTLS